MNLGYVLGGVWPISGYRPSAACVGIYIVTDGHCVPLNLGYVLGGGWPILGYLPSAACVEIYIVTDGHCAPLNLGYVLGGGWPILGYRPSAACVEILYSYGRPLRPVELRICTWRRMADFGLSTARRMCRYFIKLRLPDAPR